MGSHAQTAKDWCTKVMALADVVPNGPRPFDPQILDPAFYSRARRDGALGLGESYVDGLWECEQLDELTYRLLDSQVDRQVRFSLPQLLVALRGRLFNLQSVRRAFQVGKRHYDLGNDLFAAMLGPTMAYSCAYWRDSETLDEAQRAKFRLIGEKLDLKPGLRVAEFGCGWGTFARYAAREHGVKVVGLTVSQEQADYARKSCEGLPVEIRLQDYRKFDERVDRVVSVGMFEHVGAKNYGTFMKTARRALGDRGGLFLLRTIGSLRDGVNKDPWMDRYIFPNGSLPSLDRIARAAEGRFVVESVDNFGLDYSRTLEAWHENFLEAWPRLAARYGDRFFRMWTYYLLTCAGAFRARRLQLWQIVLSPRGVMPRPPEVASAGERGSGA
jgi:cyclopropane-fatty-acyl-phospholipid synthase